MNRIYRLGALLFVLGLLAEPVHVERLRAESRSISPESELATYAISDDQDKSSGYVNEGMALPMPTLRYMKLSVERATHEAYGLAYPGTYELSLPAGAANLRTFVSYRYPFNWKRVRERTSDEIFNGQDAVRFDYAGRRAYISVSFDSFSDEIYIRITDSLGASVDISYLGMPKYYDNRHAAVVFSGDDWGRAEQDELAFESACDIMSHAGIWFTAGIITKGFVAEGGIEPNWDQVQAKLNQGFLELASHSRSHSHIPYTDYDSEIAGSAEDIRELRNLPYSAGDEGYVLAWLSPFGISDSTCRRQLGQSRYLVNRSYSKYSKTFANWDPLNGIYDFSGYSIEMGDRMQQDCGWCGECTSDVARLNAMFDLITTTGQIYHLVMHPRCVDWSPGSFSRQHIDHIKGRPDIWYVGLGYLYLYHFLNERRIVTVAEGFEQLACGDCDASQNIDADDVIYILSQLYFEDAPTMSTELEDVDCSGDLDIQDAIFLINYLFLSGDAPCTCAAPDFVSGI